MRYAACRWVADRWFNQNEMKTKSDSESVVKHYYARADENKKKKTLRMEHTLKV